MGMGGAVLEPVNVLSGKATVVIVVLRVTPDAVGGPEVVLVLPGGIESLFLLALIGVVTRGVVDLVVVVVALLLVVVDLVVVVVSG